MGEEEEKNPIPKKIVRYSDAIKKNLINYGDIQSTLVATKIASQNGVEIGFDRDELSKLLQEQGFSGDKLQEALSKHEEAYKQIIANKSIPLNFSFTPQHYSSEEDKRRRTIQSEATLGNSTLGFTKERAESVYGTTFSAKALTGANNRFNQNNKLYIGEDGDFVKGNPEENISFWGNFGRELKTTINDFGKNLRGEGLIIMPSLNSIMSARDENKYLVLATNREYFNAYFQNNPDKKREIENEYGSLQNYLASQGKDLDDVYTDSFGRGIYKVARNSEISDNRVQEGGLGLSDLSWSWGQTGIKVVEGLAMVPKAVGTINSLPLRIRGLFDEEAADLARLANAQSNKFYNQFEGTVQGDIESGSFFTDNSGRFSLSATVGGAAKMLTEIGSTFGVGYLAGRGVSLGAKGLSYLGSTRLGNLATSGLKSLGISGLRSSAGNATKYAFADRIGTKAASEIVSGTFTLSSAEQGYDLAISNGYTHNEAMALSTLYGAVTHFSQKMLGNPIARQLFPKNKALNQKITSVLNEMAPAYKEALSKVTSKAEEEVVNKTFVNKALGKVFNFVKNNDIISEGTQETIEYVGSQLSNMALNAYDNYVLNDTKRDLNDDISLNEMLENFMAGSLISGTLGAGSAIKRQISKRNRLNANNDFSNFADLAAYYVANGRESELIQELSNMKEEGTLGVEGIDILGNLKDGKLSSKSSNEFMYDWALNQIKIAKKNQLEASSKIVTNKDGEKVKFSKLKSEEKYNYVRDYADSIFNIEEDKRGKGLGLELLQNKFTEEYVKNNNLIVDNYLTYMQEDLGVDSGKKAAIVVEEGSGTNGKRIVKEYGRPEFVEYNPNVHVLTNEYQFKEPTKLESTEIQSLVGKMGINNDVFIDKNNGVNIETSVLDEEVKRNREKLKEQAKQINDNISALEKEIEAMPEDDTGVPAMRRVINDYQKRIKKAEENKEKNKEYEDIEKLKEDLNSLLEKEKDASKKETKEKELSREKEELAEKERAIAQLDKFYEDVKKTKRTKENKTDIDSLLGKLKDFLNVPIAEKDKELQTKEVYTIPRKYLSKRRPNVISFFNSSINQKNKIKGKEKKGYNYDIEFEINSDLNDGFFGKVTKTATDTISPKVKSLIAMIQAVRENEVMFSYYLDVLVKKARLKKIFEGYDVDIEKIENPVTTYINFSKILETNNNLLAEDAVFNEHLSKKIEKFKDILDKLREEMENSSFNKDLYNDIIEKRDELNNLLQKGIETEINKEKIDKRLSTENEAEINKINGIINNINNSISYLVASEEIEEDVAPINSIKTDLGKVNENYVLNLLAGVDESVDFKLALKQIYDKVVSEGAITLSDNELAILDFISLSKDHINLVNAMSVMIEKDSRLKPNEKPMYPEFKGLKPLNVQEFRNYYNESGNEDSILNLLNKIDKEIAKKEDKRREIILEEAHSYLLERIKNIQDLVNKEIANSDLLEDSFFSFVSDAFSGLEIEKDLAEGEKKEDKIIAAEKIYAKMENIILQGLKDVQSKTNSKEEYDDVITAILRRTYPTGEKEGTKTFLNMVYYPRVEFANDLNNTLSENDIIPSLEQINFLYEALAYLQVPNEIKEKIPAYNIISGEAGSGKTMLIEKVLKISKNIKIRKTGDKNAKLNVVYSTPASELGKEFLANTKIDGVDIHSIEAPEKETKQKTKEVVEAINTFGESDLIVIDEYAAFHENILSAKGNILFLGDRTQISFSGNNHANINSTDEIKSPFRSGSIENFNFNRLIRGAIKNLSSNISLPDYLGEMELKYTDEYGIEAINTSEADRSSKNDEFSKRAKADAGGLYIGNIKHHSLEDIVNKFQGRSFDTVYVVYDENNSNTVNASALYVLATRAKKKLVILNNTNKPINSKKVSKEEMRLFPDAKNQFNRDIAKKDIDGFFKIYEDENLSIRDGGDISSEDTPTLDTKGAKTPTSKTGEKGTPISKTERDKAPTPNTKEKESASIKTKEEEGFEIPQFTDNLLQELNEKASEKDVKVDISDGEIIISKDDKTVRFLNEQDAIEYIDNIIEKPVIEIEREESLEEFEERMEEVLDTDESIEIDVNDVLKKINDKSKEEISFSEKDFVMRIKEIYPDAEVTIKEITKDKKEKQVEIIIDGVKIVEPINLSNESSSLIEISKKIEKAERQRLSQEFLNLLERLNTETTTVFNTLYIPVNEYESLSEEEKRLKIIEVAKRANNFEISNAEEVYTIKNEEVVNIITNERKKENVLYDSNGLYIGVLGFSFLNKDNPLQKELIKLSREESVSVRINNVTKILPLSLSKGTEKRSMREVKQDLEGMGYFVYENPIVATSGDIALIFFNDEEISKQVSARLKDVRNFEEYKKVIKDFENKIGFIYFQENNVFDNDVLANEVAEMMYNDLIASNKANPSKEDKNNFLNNVKQFFTLGRFLKNDNDGNVGLSWNLMYFLKDIFEKYGTDRDKMDTGMEYSFINREGVEEKVKINEGLKSVISKVAYFFDELMRVEEEIKDKIAKQGDLEDINKLNAKKMSILRSAIYSKPLLQAIKRSYENNKEDFSNIIKNANLQLNAVRSETVRTIKTIDELGNLFSTEISFPMPYVKAEIKKTDISKEEEAKRDCQSGGIKKVLNKKSKR